MSLLRIALLLIISAVAIDRVPSVYADGPPELLRVQRIWDAAEHNAFTDLVRHRDAYYCVFREGSGHVPGTDGRDGTVRIIRSTDLERWESVALLREPGIDLRDPKISIMPDGRLMIVMGGSNYDGNTLLDRISYVSQSDDTLQFRSRPSPIHVDAKIASPVDWLWRVTWHDGRGYGAIYQPSPENWKLQLVSTADGLHYKHLSRIDVPGRPNETTIRFIEDTLWAVIRREGADRSGILASSQPPLTSWNFTELSLRLGGPNFLVMPSGQFVLATRDYLSSGAKTVVGALTQDGSFTPWMHLPSGGDTSYPGLVRVNDRLLVSYYSSHEEKTAIYLAEIKIE